MRNSGVYERITHGKRAFRSYSVFRDPKTSSPPLSRCRSQGINCKDPSCKPDQLDLRAGLLGGSPPPPWAAQDSARSPSTSSKRTQLWGGSVYW